MGFESEGSSVKYGGVIAICAAFFVVSLFIGAVLPAVDGWDDLNFPALTLAKSANLAPTQGAILSSGGLHGLLFDGASQVNEVYGEGEVLHSYKTGSNLYPHVHWMPTTNDAGNVTWFLEYAVVDVNGVYGTPTIISVTEAASGTAWTHQRADFAFIDGSNLVFGSHFEFRLYRNPLATTDTYAHNAALISFGIHYQLDSVGSSEIDVK